MCVNSNSPTAHSNPRPLAHAPTNAPTHRRTNEPCRRSKFGRTNRGLAFKVVEPGNSLVDVDAMPAPADYPNASSGIRTRANRTGSTGWFAACTGQQEFTAVPVPPPPPPPPPRSPLGFPGGLDENDTEDVEDPPLSPCLRASLSELMYSEISDDRIRDARWRRERMDTWLTVSGAYGLRDKPGQTSFDEYMGVGEGTDVAAEDMQMFQESIATIDLDVPRTHFECATQPLWSELLRELDAKMGEGGFHRQLRALLVAAVRRLQTVEGGCGYTQGWSWVFAVLLCFGEPEEVFWLFVTLCEEILGCDFYSEPPAALNGAMVEAKVVELLLHKELGREYDATELSSVASMMTVKLGVPLLADIVFPSYTIAVWDRMFTSRCADGLSFAIAATISSSIPSRRRPTKDARLASVDHAMDIRISEESQPRDEQDEEDDTQLPLMAQVMIATRDGTTVVTKSELDVFEEAWPSGMMREARMNARSQLAESWSYGHNLVSHQEQNTAPRRSTVQPQFHSPLFPPVPPSQRQIEKAAGFTQGDLEALRVEFQRICEASPSNDDGSAQTTLDEIQVVTCLEAINFPFSCLATERLVRMYDRDGSGRYDFRELCCLLSAITIAPIDTRLRLAFEAFDASGDGFLELDEARGMAQALARAVHTDVDPTRSAPLVRRDRAKADSGEGKKQLDSCESTAAEVRDQAYPT